MLPCADRYMFNTSDIPIHNLRYNPLIASYLTRTFSTFYTSSVGLRCGLSGSMVLFTMEFDEQLRETSNEQIDTIIC